MATPAEHGGRLGSRCIPNISPRGRRLRFIAGCAGFLLAALLFWALVATDANRWWRLTLFFPLAMAGTGFFQAAMRTCVALARVDKREAGGGVEDVIGEQQRRQIRRQARSVELYAAAFATVLTAASLFLPPF